MPSAVDAAALIGPTSVREITTDLEPISPVQNVQAATWTSFLSRSAASSGASSLSTAPCISKSAATAGHPNSRANTTILIAVSVHEDDVAHALACRCGLQPAVPSGWFFPGAGCGLKPTPAR